MTHSFTSVRDVASPDAAAHFVQKFGHELGADRCFLYLRDPQTDCGQVVACWRKSQMTPDLPDHDYYIWQAEDRFLHDGDPMFTAALSGHPATYVADIEDAGGLVDVAFERGFMHRALVHINLNVGGKLWGILQPAMSTAPRFWTHADETLCMAARDYLTPLAQVAVTTSNLAKPAVRLVGLAGQEK